MQITTDKAALLRALALTHTLAAGKLNIPILCNVLLRASPAGVLTVTATDLEIAITASATVTVTVPGACAAPAAALHDIVRRLPDTAAVTLVADDGGLRLSAGRYRSTLATLPVEDFPTLAAGGQTHRFALPASALRGLIDRARFAMSNEETRYYLCGIYLHAAAADDASPVLRAVATDGHRLARVDAPLPAGAADMPAVIVPRRTVIELRKLLADLTEDVVVELSDTRIRITAAASVLTSKLIDGTFPDYARIIPAGNPATLRIATAALVGAAGRVAAIDTDRARGVKFTLAPGAVAVCAARTESGHQATEEIDAAECDYDGPAMEIGFQWRYIADVAEVSLARMRIAIADPLAPVVISDDADAAALYVIMPLRV